MSCIYTLFFLTPHNHLVLEYELYEDYHNTLRCLNLREV